MTAQKCLGPLHSWLVSFGPERHDDFVERHLGSAWVQKDYFCKGWVQVLMVVILKIMINLIFKIFNDQSHDHEGEDLLDRTVFVV